MRNFSVALLLCALSTIGCSSGSGTPESKSGTFTDSVPAAPTLKISKKEMPSQVQLQELAKMHSATSIIPDLDLIDTSDSDVDQYKKDLRKWKENNLDTQAKTNLSLAQQNCQRTEVKSENNVSENAKVGDKFPYVFESKLVNSSGKDCPYFVSARLDSVMNIESKSVNDGRLSSLGVSTIGTVKTELLIKDEEIKKQSKISAANYVAKLTARSSNESERSRFQMLVDGEGSIEFSGTQIKMKLKMENHSSSTKEHHKTTETVLLAIELSSGTVELAKVVTDNNGQASDKYFINGNEISREDFYQYTNAGILFF